MFPNFLIGNGEGVLVTHGLLLPQLRWEGGHDLCLSDPETWSSVVMVKSSSVSGKKDGVRQGGKVIMACALLNLRRGGVSSRPSPHPSQAHCNIQFGGC